MRGIFFVYLAAMAALLCPPAHAEVGDTWEVVTTYVDNPFNGREGVAMAEFQGKLWGTGGRKNVCSCDPPLGDPCECGLVYEYYDDLWVSVDGGETWVSVYEDAPFAERYLAKMFSLGEYLYLMGGKKSNSWRSTNGIDWIQIERNSSSGYYPPVIYKDNIILIGSKYYSDDGETWKSDSRFVSTPFSDISSYDLDAVVHGEYIYAFQSQHVWRSPDGYTWTELEGNTEILRADYPEANLAMASFAGYLWIAGNFGTSPGGGGQHSKITEWGKLGIHISKF